jgi:hypothetical protein
LPSRPPASKFGPTPAGPLLEAVSRNAHYFNYLPFDGNVFEYTVEPDGVTLRGRVVLAAPDAQWAGLAPLTLADGTLGAVGARNRDGALVVLGRDPAGAADSVVERATDLGEAAGATWAAISTGVFDAAEGTLVVAARSAPDGAILLRTPPTPGAAAAPNTVASARFGADVRWGGVAACDLEGDGVAEIIAARNRDAHVLLLRRDGDTLRVDAEIDAFGPASAWAGLTCGDFDGDGRREVAAVRNFDGGLYVFALDAAGAFVSRERVVTMGASTRNAPLATGRLYPDWPADVLAGASNRTGHVFVWSRAP